MRTIIFCCILFICRSVLPAQVPAGYYDDADGLYGTALQQQLHEIIDNHTPLQYTQLHALFPFTDARADNTVWDMYSDVPGGTPPYVYYFIPSDQCGNYSQEGDCYNREHSFPKSWFGGEVMPMFTDLFHVYPTDGFVNNQRGNLPYGETDNASWTSMNGSRVGPGSLAGYTATVFEPIDEYKGDLARTYFYMAVRYYGEDASWPGGPMTHGSQLLPWALEMLVQWHQDDPVSTKERDRNEAVYALQGNRNPFIDEPYFAERIWVTSAGLEDGHRSANRCWQISSPSSAQQSLLFSEAASGREVLRIFSLRGDPVAELFLPKGQRTVPLDGLRLHEGVYLYQVKDSGGVLKCKSKLLIH